MNFKNFLAASRKNNIWSFAMFPPTRDLSWIANNDDTNPTPSTVTYGTDPDFDLSNGLSQYIILTGPVNTSRFVLNGGLSIPEGMQFWLHVEQDAVGGWQFNFPTTVRNPAVQFASLTPSTRTTFCLEYHNSGWDFITPAVEGPTS